MKITDLNVIKTEAWKILSERENLMEDYFTADEAAEILTMIYATNDKMRGFAQDFVGNMSIVSSPTRVCVIFQGSMSFYSNKENICEYEDLAEDLESILVCVDAAIARWESGRE